MEMFNLAISIRLYFIPFQSLFFSTQFIYILFQFLFNIIMIMKFCFNLSFSVFSLFNTKNVIIQMNISNILFQQIPFIKIYEFQLKLNFRNLKAEKFN